MSVLGNTSFSTAQLAANHSLERTIPNELSLSDVRSMIEGVHSYKDKEPTDRY